MSAPALRTAFRAARLPQRQAPAAFFRSCRDASRRDSPLNHTRAAHSIALNRGSQTPLPELRTQQAGAGTPIPLAHQRNHFSSTASPRAVSVRLNPRVDDEGHEMTIEISERAANRLRQITSSQPTRNTLSSSSPDSHLRIMVTSGGCHGFQYIMSLEGASKIDEEEDTVFQAAVEGDASGRAEVVMDMPSLELLKGSTVDFTTELIGSQFKIVGNPRAKSSCGCGTSFDVE